ncbi:unnamed protein product [Effrenium voratum]|nr:unnamed protein product [Effrenium voratum]
MSVPGYLAAVQDHDECQLLCEADELCAGAALLQPGLCEVRGLAQALGSPTPEGARTAVYEADSSQAPSETAHAGQRRPGFGLRRVLLTTYATGKIFEETQRRLHDSLEIAEISEHWPWNKSSFESGVHGDWYKRHERVNFKRGGAWKPYAIWQAFRHVKWGEWLVYHDASRYVQEGFSSSVQPLLAWLEANREENPCECLAAVRLRQTMEYEWLQQCVPPYGEPVDRDRAADIFCGLMWKLGICRPSSPAECCAAHWDRPMLQHAWSVWRKNRRSARFLREWAHQAEDYDTLAHLPFVDQSLNSLLFYRWKEQLSLRALWVPSLYRSAWRQDMDLGLTGRSDGNIFKHLNFVLDELWNEGTMQRKLLHLVDPADEGRADASLAGMAWRRKLAPPARWRRSLCEAHPKLSARAVAARVFVGEDTPEVSAFLAELSGMWKSPAAWPRDVYEPLTFLDGARQNGWWRALPGVPRDALADGDALAQGFSGALRLGRLRPHFLRGLYGKEALRVLAQVTLVNDGKVAWAPGARLCSLEGNSSLKVSGLCLKDWGLRSSCGELKPGELVQLRISLALPEVPRFGEVVENKFALCAGSKKPFGVLMSFLTDFKSMPTK